MLSFREAKETILKGLPGVPAETLAVRDVMRRILAEDLTAETDLPAFDNSSMDGYALRAADTIHARHDRCVKLQVIGDVRAGEFFDGSLMPGTAVRIMTGAPIPEGADAVVEQELVDARNGAIEISEHFTGGRNIRRKGEEVRKGSVVLKQGTYLSPAAIGVLASHGIGRVKVFRQPRVALLTTGSEVVDVDVPLLPGKIRNSNAYTLWGLIVDSACKPIDLGKVGDEQSELRSRIAEGLRYDVLVTTGGISVGKHDLVLQVLKDLGVEIRFWQVSIKPGMPMAFGICDASGSHPVPVFALPGNPVSTFVTFLQLVRPALRRLSGEVQLHPPLRLFARLEHDFPKKDAKRHFVRGIVRNDPGGLSVSVTGSQSSGILSSLVAANCLIVILEEQQDLKAGDEVEIELL
ncbi:MAG: molybdopterin molybdotransferase MoeA [Ignavibacteria bacterium]|nr:molybdopterin molybdotransferase MoeA [Ignavibacteria bacterium]